METLSIIILEFWGRKDKVFKYLTQKSLRPHNSMNVDWDNAEVVSEFWVVESVGSVSWLMDGMDG